MIIGDPPNGQYSLDKPFLKLTHPSKTQIHYDISKAFHLALRLSVLTLPYIRTETRAGTSLGEGRE